MGEFRRRLTASVAAWKSAGRRGVWLMIPLRQSELISVAAEVGRQLNFFFVILLTSLYKARL